MTRESDDGASGVIFDIQRFAVHDGPGIRTIVFMKGCPLRCRWCSNPESQDFAPDLMFFQAKCTNCLSCASACHAQAISHGEDGLLVIERQLCRSCTEHECVAACPTTALQLAGATKTVEEVIEEVARDTSFYRSSKGGVTFSGGEPLAQGDFLFALLSASKAIDLNTTVETCAFADPEDLRTAAGLADHFLCDVKHMDRQAHQDGTGVDNTRVLSNIELLIRLSCDVALRVPVVPGFNDTGANITAVCGFARDLAIRRLDLLPYHRLGEGKYLALGRNCEPTSLRRPSEKHMEELRQLVLGFELECEIGG